MFARSRHVALAFGCAVAVSGCAVGGGTAQTSDIPRRDLAVRPTTLVPGADSTAATAAGSQAPTDEPTASAIPSRRNGSPTTGSAGGPTSPGGAGGRREAPYRNFATLTDAAQDAGLGAPAYADLVAVDLADNGSNIRVTVTLAGEVGARLRDGETMGVGVDLYRPGHQRESDYQLFADGEPDGWYGYLQTPKGFVRYPGAFALGPQQLVFTVPWGAVGNLTTGRYSAFVDWSRRNDGPTGNDSSNDFAPTLGTSNYSR